VGHRGSAAASGESGQQRECERSAPGRGTAVHAVTFSGASPNPDQAGARLQVTGLAARKARVMPEMVTVRGWVYGALVFAGAFLIWSVLAGALSSLVLLFTAILLAAGLRPLVNRLAKKMPFGAAVGLTFAVMLVVVVGVGFALVQPITAELVKLVQAVPGYASSLQDQFAALQRYIKNDEMARQVASTIASGAGGAVSTVGQQLLGGPRLVLGAIGDGLLIVLLAIGWILASDDLERFLLSMMSPTARTDWHATFQDIGAKLSAYVQGVVINGAVVGVVMGAGLGVLGVPYALLLGFVAAIFQAIPMVGAVISGPIILVVVLATSGWTKMLIALAIFGILQVIDQNVVSPIIFGQRVQLSFLLIILATVIGGTLLGIGGAFLAVPAAAVIQVLVVRIVAPAIRRASGAETEPGK
jgi:predicted PurR-regulated permease PerM